MADDVRISTALRNHPKTRKLQKRLGAPGVLSLIWLFLYAAESRPDGDLSGMSDEDIELSADWAGTDGQLVGSLVEVRFLDGESGHYKIHDWVEHNPWAASRPQRIEKARNAALKRWGVGIAEAIQNECGEDATSIHLAESSNTLHPPTHPPIDTKEVLSTTTRKKARHKKNDLSGYVHPEEIKELRNYLFPKWPTVRQDGAKVKLSEPPFASAVDERLIEGWSLETLKRSADLYLREKPEWAACPHNFFGPGNGNPGNFKIYAKMILHNDKANGHEPQPRLPEIGSQTPENCARAAGAGR